jgi:predicted nucleic acid-binding protein
VAVIRKQYARGNISREESFEALGFMFRQPITFFLSEILHYRAIELANQFNFPTAYDAQYLAVAEHLGCDFWTGDKRLVNAVSPTLGWVKYLGDLVVP